MDYKLAIISIVQKITGPELLRRIYSLARYLYINEESDNKKAQAPASNLDLG